MSHFSFRESLLKPKIAVPNLDFCQCFCSERLFYSKRHLYGNYYMLFQENDSSSFSRHALAKCEMGLPNLDFNDFFCCKRLMHSEWRVNRCLFIEFGGNRYNRSLRYSLPVSFPVSFTPLPLSRFSLKPENIIYAHVWYCVKNLVFLSFLGLEI